MEQQGFLEEGLAEGEIKSKEEVRLEVAKQMLKKSFLFLQFPNSQVYLMPILIS